MRLQQESNMKLAVTVKEAAELTSFGEKCIRSLISVGILNPIRLERKLIIPVMQLEEFVENYAGLSISNIEEMAIAKSVVERKKNEKAKIKN